MFWPSTVTEFFAAIEAFNELHGGPKKPAAPSQEELDKLLDRYG